MRWNWYARIGAAIIFVDQVTKWIAQRALIGQQMHGQLTGELISFCTSFNRGLSWGMLHSNNQFIFIAVSVVVCLVAVAIGAYTLARYRAGHAVWGEVVMLAGAFSNIIDRFLYGGVVDFIVLSYSGWSWPAFNIADVAIVFGAAIILGSHAWSE